MTLNTVNILWDDSRWAATWPGLPQAAARWLARLDEYLDEARRRGDSILRTPLAAPASLLRMGRLATGTAPELVPALANRDGDQIVKALAKTALTGGPTYVKIGQLISTTRGLVPERIADAFAGCRDAVPPAPTASIERVVHRSGLVDRIRSWNRTPIASASVAQVHEATLEDGRDVVIKVRRPGIVGTVAADVGYLLPALRLLESRNNRFRIANISGVVDLMVRLFAEEVDFRLEAASMAQMALALERAGADVQVPAPVPGMVTKRAFVMNRIEGVSADDVEGVAAFRHPPGTLVQLAVVGVLETTFTDGIFHGDLHPGNIIVNDQGLALVDFGIIGRLAPDRRQALLHLLMSALAEDRAGVVDALKEFGALPDDLDVAGFIDRLPAPPSWEERVEMMRDRGSLRTGMGGRLSVIVRALSAEGFKLPPELALFAKNLLYLSDAVQRHAPADYDVFSDVTAVLDELRSRFGD